MHNALEIYSAHVYHYNGTQHTTLHSHEQEYELFYSLDTSARYMCDGKVYGLTPENVLLAKPGVPHRMVSSSCGRLIDIKFTICDSFLKMRANEQILFVEDISDSMRVLLAQIADEINHKDAYSKKLISLCLETFLYMVLRENASGIQPAVENDVAHDLNIDYERLTPCVRRALPFIEGFVVLPVESFSVSALAIQCGYDNRYLSQKFKEDIGISITQYYGLIRLSKAKEFLKNSDMSISQISRLLGYTQPAHFMKYFKKYTGMSPSKYRNQVRDE